MRIHVTGGAGFIGTHVVNKLLTLGHDVVVVDCFDAQVHGDSWGVRSGLRTISLCSGSIRPDLYDGCEILIHLGAKVGVGQSMYDIDGYVGGNSFDTARMLRKLSDRKPKRLIVASSMSIYGEGLYEWKDPMKESFYISTPKPTPETHPPDLRSIYALTKYDQEQLCLIWGRAYEVPTVALRFFNTYGPGQSLNNPYTGVLAIFASRLLNNKPPVIYEDGQQSRDFIHVDDVANAVVHAALNDIPSGPYNVGTGRAIPILGVADLMSVYLAKSEDSIIDPIITGKHRAGDIRHCFADISKIKATGWTPKIPFEEGSEEYCQWLLTQPKPEDKFEQAHQELVEKGLTK